MAYYRYYYRLALCRLAAWFDLDQTLRDAPRGQENRLQSCFSLQLALVCLLNCHGRQQKLTPPD